MAIHLPTQTLVLIIAALILLVVALAALASAGGLTVPIFDQIADMIGGLSPAGK
ncbi:MAG: hypothetical protein QXD77_00070 [Candidatus Aenigmatarchaeota archaeon]